MTIYFIPSCGIKSRTKTIIMSRFASCVQRHMLCFMAIDALPWTVTFLAGLAVYWRETSEGGCIVMRRAAVGLGVFLFGVLPCLVAADAEPHADGEHFFEQRIRPLLVKRCYACHSSQANELRGGLRLDSRPGWQAGGDSGPVIVPGKPEESPLVEAISYKTDGFEMPPSGKLPDAEIADLTKWVRLGAHDPRDRADAAPEKSGIDFEAARQKWPFRRLQPVAPPRVGGESWCLTPVDRFILAHLEEQHLAPAPQADRRHLLRRAYFDLIGLPPTPEETAAFLGDDSPEAFERLIDRLLASPHYGERWARHWLDIVRFAESHGFEHDYDRKHAYHYRDFVIRALNQNLPYDTFIRWQLAGDELEPENNLALMATGFLAAGVHSTQITKNQAEKERYDELDDILATTGSAMLGLTIGCARCHDHKYDPIATRDYYRMLSTFTTTVRSEAALPVDREDYRKKKKAFDIEHAPYVAALQAFQRDELPARLARWEQDLTDPRSAFPWVVLNTVEVKSAGGARFKRLDDGSLLASGPNADHDVYTVIVETHGFDVHAIRIEALSHASLVKGGPGRGDNGNFALTDLKLTATPVEGDAQPKTVAFENPRATFEQPGLPVAAVIDADPKSGWAVDPEFGKSHAAVFDLVEPIAAAQATRLTFTLKFDNNVRHSIGRLRLCVASHDGVDIGSAAMPQPMVEILEKARDQRTAEQQAALLAWYGTLDPEWQRLHAALEQHAALAPKLETFTALISSEGVPAVRLHTQGPDFYEQTYFLRRGDPNLKGDVATQGFLQALTSPGYEAARWQVAPPKGWHTSYRRRAMAQWITDVDHGAGHLLARVIVNRLWQHHFGRGIVATPNDFGAQGESPSHRELLDWLAERLIAEGWRLKPIHRLMMRSAVYRQSSRFDKAMAEIDPGNQSLWHFPVRRVEAEVVRDAMLSVGGLLDERMFGPGTLDESSRRRSIYFTVKRSKLVPMMVLFDAPDALASQGRRPSTVVAPQALAMMNSPHLRQCAEAFARSIQSKGKASLAELARAAYLAALARQPTAAESETAVAFLGEQTASYEAASAKDAQSLALADFCQVLMGLNEFIYID